jgi:hypothetical protein
VGGFQLVDAIAESFGTKSHLILEMDKNWDGDEGFKHMTDLINSISNCLEGMKKKWVFVFDQINKLFKKGSCHASKPYAMITHVIQPGRVASVVSALANNKSSIHREQGIFLPFLHPRSMSETELPIVFKVLKDSSSQLNPILQSLTNSIPLYASLYLSEKYKGDEDAFCAAQLEEIKSAWSDLLQPLHAYFEWLSIQGTKSVTFFSE